MRRVLLLLFAVTFLISFPAAADDLSPEELKEDQFLLDGTLYSGHVRMEDLLEDGWMLDPRNEGKEYEPRSSENVISSSSVSLTKGDLRIDVCPYNQSTENPCTIEDTEILEIIVSEDAEVPFYIENGISFDATVKTIKKVYGDDYEIDHRTGYDYYKVPKMNSRISFVVEGKEVTRIHLNIPRIKS